VREKTNLVFCAEAAGRGRETNILFINANIHPSHTWDRIVDTNKQNKNTFSFAI
jgi:hypothetical protein